MNVAHCLFAGSVTETDGMAGIEQSDEQPISPVQAAYHQVTNTCSFSRGLCDTERISHTTIICTQESTA